MKAQLDGCREFFPTEATKGKPMGWQSADDWKQTIATLAEVNLVKADSKPDSFFTNDLLPA